MAITQLNPRRDSLTLREAMDRVFEERFVRSPMWYGGRRERYCQMLWIEV